jgi:ribosomal protein S25
VYEKWPAPGRHKQDLSKTAKENIAKTINQYSYIDFLVKRNEISRSIAKKISTDYSNSYFTDVTPL